MNEQNPFLEQEIDIREYFRVLVERKWLIISITVILCTLSLIRSYMMTPVYESSTNIIINKEAPRVTGIKKVTSSRRYRDMEYYRTQHKILKSRSLAEMVNKALGGYVPWSEWRVRKKENEKPLSEESRVKALLEQIKIKPVPNTRLVTITAEDSNPERAAEIADLWAKNYISYVLDVQFNASQYASGWLQSKIASAKEKLEIAEATLQNYRNENQIVVAGAKNSRKSILDQLLEKRSDLEIELSEQLEYYKEKHPEIIGIRSEMDSVERKIIVERGKELYAKDKEIQYNIFKREVDTNKEIYRTLLKRIGETEVMAGLKTTNIRIVDAATIPKGPIKPNKKKDLLIALLLGFMAGGGLAFLIEGLDQSIKTPDDIKNHIQLPPLASIAVPHEAEDKEVQPAFISFKKPRSTISEAYRSLRTSIMFTSVENKRKTLLVTSSGPQEGKTTTAINLAIVMAKAGERTILLDADLRQPKIEKYFETEMEHGMTEVLAGSEDIDTVLYKTDIPNFDLITCGTIPPNPSELLGSKRMDKLIEELEERYDRVIIDTPPVLAVTDAVVLSGKVDGSIIVVRSGETNRNALLRTKEIMSTIKPSGLIGVVLNMVEMQKTGGYYYYHHYYGKYGKYGHKEENKTPAKVT